MRIITLFIALVFIACNNSSEKKTGIKDTANKTNQMPATTIMPDTSFYGLGTEPFWSFYIIDQSKVVFHLADGPDVVADLKRTSNGDNITQGYAAADGVYIDFIITKKPCSDGMSERVHTYEVSLTVNKEKYKGCGNDKPANMDNE